jgi:hypothetical protein
MTSIDHKNGIIGITSESSENFRDAQKMVERLFRMEQKAV